MKADTLLDAVVFQLTPTRTRYDLIIIANGKTEKIESGLLDPFLAHLKTAEDQIAAGGYSIRLEPDTGAEASWFTKDTVERFVRYVSTPEVLDRVNALESEILQINEAIAIQGNGGVCSSIVEDHLSTWTGSIRGSKFPDNGDKEKAILLSKHGKHRRLSTGFITQEVNSRRQLLRVLESRKTVLRKEQGMSFARAVAAGFDIDHMSNLISFGRSFGAFRLLEACLGFVELWKAKYKNGQWIETEIVSMKASHNVFSYNLAAENNDGDYHASDSNLTSRQLNSDLPKDSPARQGPQHYHPNLMLPQWASHGPPVSHSYPLQSMSYYHSYPVTGLSFPSHDPIKMALKRHSMDNKISDDKSMNSEIVSSNTTMSQAEIGSDFGMKTCPGQKSSKKVGNSGKRRSRAKQHKTNDMSESESKTTSTVESEEEILSSQSDSPSKKHKSSSRSVDNNETDGGSGNWQTFQKLLLRIQTQEDTSAVDSSHNEIQGRRRPNRNEVDPSIPNAQDNGDAPRSDPISENEYRNDSNMYNVSDESFIVPIRTGIYEELVKGKSTDMVCMNSDSHSAPQKNNDIHICEPNDLSIMPERGLEKGSISFDPAKDFDMQIHYGIKKGTKSQEDVSKRARERLKGLGKERELSNGQYGLEKRKLDTVTTKVKSSKSNPLADAKVRAEKLRVFKADLQKIKKEKEEEERKRLEALKKEREKRIAARSSLNNAHSSLSAPQTKARKITGHALPSSNSTKFSDTAPTSFSSLRKPAQPNMKPKHIGASMTTNTFPNPYKSTKFSDMQPSPSSPLLKLLRSSKSVAQSTSSPQKAIVSLSIKKSPSISRSNAQPTRVASSSEKGSKFNDTAPSSLSFHKTTKLDRLNGNTHLVGTGSKQVSKSPRTSQSSRMHDQVPKNKIRAVDGPTEEAMKKVSEGRCSNSFSSESVQTKKANKAILTLINYEEDPIVEKAVVILEDKIIPSPGILCEDNKREGIEPASEHQALHSPPLTFIGGEADNSRECEPERQPSSYQVIDPPTENPNQPPFDRARVEDHNTGNLEHTERVDQKMAKVDSERINTRACTPVERISAKKRHKIDEKPRSRGSPRRFKELVKFPCKGKHSSSDNSGDDACRIMTTASNNAPTLKDLLSKDGHPGGTPPKAASRRLSSFSPFHNKSSKKKAAA